MAPSACRKTDKLKEMRAETAEKAAEKREKAEKFEKRYCWCAENAAAKAEWLRMVEKAETLATLQHLGPRRESIDSALSLW